MKCENRALQERMSLVGWTVRLRYSHL